MHGGDRGHDESQPHLPLSTSHKLHARREEQSKRDLILKADNKNPPEASVATLYFDIMEENRVREQTFQKPLKPTTHPSIDWAALMNQRAGHSRLLHGFTYAHRRVTLLFELIVLCLFFVSRLCGLCACNILILM